VKVKKKERSNLLQKPQEGMMTGHINWRTKPSFRVEVNEGQRLNGHLPGKGGKNRGWVGVLVIRKAN